MSYEVGQTYDMTFQFTKENVKDFASVSQDLNPVHLDEDFAATTMFKKPIVHGMFACSLISGVLGQHLPGPGTIYLAQDVKFLAPIFVGDTVTVRCEVVEISEKGRAKLSTSVVGADDDKPRLTGEASVLLPKAA